MGALQRFRELPRLKVGLSVAFVTFHVGVTLVRGAATGLREPALELTGWYSEGLRMATTWGMFSKAPDPTDVVVMGVLEDNRRVEIELVKHPADATLETPSNPAPRERVQSLKCNRRALRSSQRSKEARK